MGLAGLVGFKELLGSLIKAGRGELNNGVIVSKKVALVVNYAGNSAKAGSLSLGFFAASLGTRVEGAGVEAHLPKLIPQLQLIAGRPVLNAPFCQGLLRGRLGCITIKLQVARFFMRVI